MLKINVCLMVLFQIILICYTYFPVIGNDVKIVIDSRNNERKIPLRIIKILKNENEQIALSTKYGVVENTSLSLNQTCMFDLNGSLIMIDEADSLCFTFDLKKNKYVVSGGKYADNYTIIDKAGPYKLGKFDTSSENYKDYVTSVEGIFNKILYRIDSIRNEGKTSENVYNYVKEYFNYKKTLAILAPIKSSNAKDLWGILDNDWKKKSYNYLIKPQFGDMALYQMAVFSYFICKTYNDYDNQFELHFYNTILDENFPKEIKLSLMGIFFIDNSLPLKIDKSSLNALYERIKHLESSPELKQKFKNGYESYLINGVPIPDSIQHQIMLITTDGKELSLKQILDKFGGKKIFLDFWASWCVPCIANIPNVKVLAETRKDIEVIYISLDENQGNWRKGFKKHDIINNQYLLLDSFKSKLARYLLLDAIPFYLFLDSKGICTKINHLIEVPNW